MEQNVDTAKILDLLVRPGFCVHNNSITAVNQSARTHLLEPGTDVTALLRTGREEYAEFSGGCLYLTLDISGESWGASVSRVGDADIFVLEREADQAELQAMALAARELREPLTAVMTTADRLFPMAALDGDDAAREQAARLNRGLYQMLRVISNMSDASRYTLGVSRQETVDICALLAEIFTKAEELVAHAGIRLTFTVLPASVYCLADGERLERAVLNIVSNAVKFTPAGGAIDARLTQRGSKLYLTVQDSGQGVAQELRGTIHSRYLRQPAIEDSRFGIGLGMVLIRSAAAQHGGTVLVDQPEGCGTRITMTLEIRQAAAGTLRSNILRVDYAGERDHTLLELSDTLPAELYDTKKIN